MPHNNILNRAQGRKKSLFPALTAIPSDATLDFVSGSTNFKITLNDFLAALNVTGTIVQEGAVTSTPVLDTQGSVHNIRNLKNGSGVKASLNGDNGITLDHNFLLDGTGTPLSADFTITQPVFRSLIAGSGIVITPSGDKITITQTGSPKQEIVEPTSTFQALASNDIINCTGTFTVTLPAASSFLHEVTITSTSGTISLAADITINNSSPITTVSSATFYIAQNTWWRK